MSHQDDLDFDRVIRPILEPDEGDVLQVIYLKTKDGTLYPFIGATLPDEVWEKMEIVIRGELVGIEWDSEDDLPDHAPRSTSHRRAH